MANWGGGFTRGDETEGYVEGLGNGRVEQGVKGAG